jgi:hypothetical protein
MMATRQFGWKRLFNNQTGSALVYTCLGYNGVSCFESAFGVEIDLGAAELRRATVDQLAARIAAS